VIRHVTHLPARVGRTLRDRIAQMRQEPDAGGHAIEYAVGIAVGLTAMALVYVAYKAGIAHIIATWTTDVTGP
jgi:hypothetical protein